MASKELKRMQEENENLRLRIKELESIVSPEMREYMVLQRKIVEAEEKLSESQREVAKLKEKRQELEANVRILTESENNEVAKEKSDFALLRRPFYFVFGIVFAIFALSLAFILMMAGAGAGWPIFETLGKVLVLCGPCLSLSGLFFTLSKSPKKSWYLNEKKEGPIKPLCVISYFGLAMILIFAGAFIWSV